MLSHGQLSDSQFPWLLRRELRRVVTSAKVLPLSRLVIPQEWLTGIGRLPRSWQSILFGALGSPDDWPVKRVCAVLSIDRSTLDRGFRRQSLPTLSTMFRMSRA